MSHEPRSDVPSGYARATPYILYADAERAVRFLRDAFAFEEVEDERVTDGDGRVTHTAMKVIDQAIMVGSPAADFRGPAQVGATVHVYVYVPDADAHCDRARGAGATIVTEPEDAPYGDRRYAAQDTEGHHWWFATHRG
jgi:uncharacterized glyoxalase superfamily protein PhnB